MRRTLTFPACIVFLFLSGLSVQSQENKAASAHGGCSKLHVIGGDWNNPAARYPNKFSATQMQWWTKDGQKKFKNVCLVSRLEDADYVFMWAEQWRDYNQQITVPKTTTTQHTGTVDTTSTTGASTSGTYRGTSTTTTYEKESYEYAVQRVMAYLYNTEIVDGTRKIVMIPIFSSDHKGQWRWSKPDKDAFIDALKFIAKQAK
jgi:hypothetical protein